MSPRQSAEHAAEDALLADVARRTFSMQALLILWPAFVMAAVLEGLVFVTLDPAALRGVDFDAAGLSVSAVYSITFMIFWGVIATSGAITQLLAAPGPAIPHRPEQHLPHQQLPEPHPAEQPAIHTRDG
jgi:hypothetical protein